MQDDPNWIGIDVALGIHAASIERFGGTLGIRDEGLLDSALNRPRHLFAYGSTDLIDLAASYAFGIAKNHPFLDGNKRTAFLVAATFLEDNGYTVTAPEPEAAVATLGLADGSIPEEGFAAFLRDYTIRQK